MPRSRQSGSRRRLRSTGPRTKANVVGRDAARRAILVLGMHRSGTSVLTRVLSLLGASLPKKLDLPESGRANEAGHWESRDLVAIHDDLLASGGSTWHDWRAFNAEWSASDVAEVYQQRLLDLLKQDFGESRFFIIKDPRICRFAPVWFEVLEQFDSKTHVVMPIRNPLEVAASLQRRNGFSPAKSYMLWLRHVLDAELTTRERPRAFLTYDALLDDWRGVVADIAARAKISWPRRSDYTDADIDRYISSELRHHVAEPGQLATRTDIAGWVKEAFQTFRRMAEEGESERQLRRLDQIRAEFNSASAAFGLVLAGEAAQSSSDMRALAAIQAELAARSTELASSQEEWARERAELEKALSESRQALVEQEESAGRRAAIQAELVARSTELASSQEEWARQRAELEKALSESRQALVEQEESAGRQRNGLEAALEESRQQLLAKQREAAQYRADLQAARRETQEQLSAKEGAVAQQVSLLEMTLTEIRQLLAEKEDAAARQLRDLAQQFDEKEAALEETCRELAEARDEAGRRRAELASAQSKVRGRDAEVARLARELGAVRALLRESQAAVQHLGGERDGAEAKLERVQAEVEAQVSTASQQNTAQAVRIQDLERRLEQHAEERTGLRDELVRSATELSRAEAAAAQRIAVLESIHAAALVGIENKAQEQMRTLRDRLIDAEAALAKYRNSGRSGTLLVWLFAATKRRTTRQLLNSGLFDTEWYMREYPEIAESDLPPVEHYLQEGYLHGYRPNPVFDTRWYLERYEDVRRAGINPLVHYLRYGHQEGRNPGPEFETDFYLLTNPDVRNSRMNPLSHYLRYGKTEGRLPSKPPDGG